MKRGIGLGRGSFWRYGSTTYHALFDPLSARERLLIGLILGAGLLGIIALRVTASDGDVGSVFSVPVRQCTSDGAWLSPELVPGQPAVGITDQKNSITEENAAQNMGDVGAIDCIGFVEDEEHIRVNTTLNVALAALEDQDTEPVTDQGEQLTVNTADLSSQRVDYKISNEDPNLYGEVEASLDKYIVVSISRDNGVSWQQLHTISSAIADETQPIYSIALPDEYASSLDELAVRVELASTEGSNTTLLLDSIYITYSVGKPHDLELKALDDQGNELNEEAPLLGADGQLDFELTAKDPNDGLAQGVAASLLGNDQEPEVTIEAEIVREDGQKVAEPEVEISWSGTDIQKREAWDIDVAMPDSSDPGKYTVNVEVTSEDGGTQSVTQDFLWGVLAFNPDSTIYRADEAGSMAITVLDERGATVCDANVSVEISGPDGVASYSTANESIQISEQCTEYGSHILPDYSFVHTFSREGTYNVDITASSENGEFSIADQIEVANEQPLSIHREGPTRLFPPVRYPMRLTITAHEAFTGEIYEYVPASFDVSKTVDFATPYDALQVYDGKTRLAWKVSLEAGETATVGYSFKAPNISPEFYLLGPAEAFTDGSEEPHFAENRNWQLAGDAVGDIAIYREATGTEAIGTGLSDQAWDTTITQGSGFSIDGSRTLIDLADGGHYFITYNIGLETSGGSNRSEIQSIVDIAGTDQAYGRSSCYIRRAGGTDECWISGAAIIDSSAGDDVKIEAQRTDSNSATVQRRSNESGFSLFKLDDSWNYARIREAGGGQSFDSATFAPVDWDTNDELDTGFSRSGGDITLSSAGHYLVTSNVMFQNSSGSARRNAETRLTLNGTEIEGSRTSAYLRGSNGTQDHAAVYSGIIEAGAGEVLRLEAACEGESCGGVTNVGNQTAISIVKLPDSADYIRLYENTGGQAVDGTLDPIAWDSQQEVDSGSFSHSTGTNPSRINIDNSNDYLFFGSFYSLRNPTSSGTRHYPHWQWRLNGGSVEQLGSFGKYNRGDQGSEGTFSGGDSGAIILNGLSDTDYLELVNTDESSGGDANNTFIGDRIAVQGVNLNSLLASAPVTTQNHFRWRDDSTALNTGGGWEAAEDSNAIGAKDKNAPLRLRISVANTGTAAEAGSRQYELQFADATGSSCSAVSSWTGIADSVDAFDMNATTNIDPDGETTTPGLLGNAEAYSYVNGEGRDTADTTGSIGPLSANNYTELEYSIEITDEAITGHTYCFRVYDQAAGSIIDNYAAYPTVTIDSETVEFGAYGEAGTFSSAVDGGWSTVNFINTYSNPVVVGTSNSHNGQSALVFQAQNVTSTSAEMRVCESEGATSDGCDTHASETVGYLVIDADQVGSIDGLEAGTFTTSGADDSTNVTTNYTESFSSTPYVFANTNTADDADQPTEVVINSTSTANFNAGICSHQLGSNDSCDTGHGNETVGWVAIEPGNEPFVSEHLNGSESIGNSTWTGITFTPNFTSTPALIVASQTDAGGQDVEIDEGRLVTTSGADIRYCEIDTVDNCDTHASDTVVWAAFEQTDFPGTSTSIDQDSFRFYENTDAIQPTTPLAAENTAYNDVGTGEILRLRMAMQIGDTDLPADTARFRLQYTQSADCSAAGSWTDVGGIGSGAIWRGYDNPSAADGDDITASLINAGGNVLASYVEENNSAANPNAINAGQRGEWGWVIENNGAAEGTDYCFRAVTFSGATIHYSRYPAVTTAQEPIQQLHFRWRDDATDLNSSGGWLAAEDSNAIGDRNKLDTQRIRFEVANTGTGVDSLARQYQIQVGTLGDLSDCSAVSSWTGLNTAAEFNMADSDPHIDPDGEAATTGLLANTETYSYTNGEGRDAVDTTGSIGPLAATSYTEVEYSIAATTNAVTGETYCFRLYDSLNATELDSYAVYPQLTLEEVAIDNPIGEFGTVNLTDGNWQTVNLTNAYEDPVVVASPRYAQTSSAVPERSPRVRNKTATTFEIKVDNHDNTVTGSTTVDYIVFETGTHTVTTDGGSFELVADTHNTNTMVVCNGGSSGTGGDLINFPLTFSSAPIVLNTISSDSDTSWVTSHVHGTAFNTNPTTTQMRLGLDRSFDTCTHGAEDIDYIALEQIHDTHNSVEFESNLSADNVAGGFPGTGYANSFAATFSTTPQVAVTSMQRVDGVNGGISFLHTGGTALSTTTYNTSTDEFGPGADRAHTTEPVGIVAFAASSGTIVGDTYSLDQDTYRIYENEDNLTPSISLAAESSPYDGIADNQVIRIRMGIQIGNEDLNANKQSFTLQYTQASDCSVAGSWSDVGATGSGAIWRGFANSTPSDGDTLSSSLLNGGSNTLASYEEGNDSASNPTTINQNDRGEWDWVIQNNGASYSTDYCFRMITTAGDTLVYSAYPQVTTASPARLIMLYDGTFPVTDWTCISCNPGDDFYDTFIRGEATYGGTGGALTHTHTTTNGGADPTADASTESRSGAQISSVGHGHAFTYSLGSASNLPPYRQLQVIQYDFNGTPPTIPANAIGLFDAAPPAGWATYGAQNGSFTRGQATAGSPGGTATHAHTITGSLGAATGTTEQSRGGGSQTNGAASGHTHTVNGNSDTVNHEPPFMEFILAQASSSTAPPDGLIGMWDDTLSANWTCISCTAGDDLYQRFFKAAAAYGATGGSATHSHGDSSFSSGPPSATDNGRTGSGGASDTHTHTVNVTNYSSSDHLPPYRNAIFARLSNANTAPNDPSGLDQIRVTAASSIATGGWTDETQVEFEALVSDADNPDDLELCVEVQPLGIGFTGSETGCGTPVTFSGSAITASVTLTGLTADEEFHWQARVRDSSGAYSGWVSYGANLETESDFGIDTTDPTGAIRDGVVDSLDIDFNNGDLDELSDNWDRADALSGLATVEASIGSSPGATDISGWNNEGLIATNRTTTSLSLDTQTLYYANLRLTDNAGNQVVFSSDGQWVLPTISFSTSPGQVDFGNLNAGNSFTSTSTTTLTTSTNAFGGYVVRAFIDGLLTNEASDTVGVFNGGTYVSPDEWLGGDTGYGYTSDDPLIQGSNIFNNTPCPGGGNPPCFAPFAILPPGDIVADNQGPVSGTPITNEQFDVTHRVTADANQESGVYQTTVIYTVTARY